MKLEKKHTETIKNQFAQINSKKDIIDLINYVNQLVYGKDFKPLTDKGFNYYANPQVSKKRYKTFSVKKKNGGERIINAPVAGLKHILRPLNVILNVVAQPHFKAMGLCRISY